MQPRNSCHCGSSKWKKQGDGYVCQYGHQFTEVEEVGDDDLLYGSQQRERARNKQKKSKEKEARKSPSNQTILLFYQNVLKLQVKWMLKNKIDIPEYENIVCQIWILWTNKFVYKLPDIEGQVFTAKMPKLTADEIRPIYTIIFCNLALWILRIPYPPSDYIKWIYSDGFPYVFNQGEKIDWPNHSSTITIPSISDLIKHQHRILATLEAQGMPIHPPYQSPLFVKRIFAELRLSVEFYPFYCKIYESLYQHTTPEMYKLKHGVQTSAIALVLAKLNPQDKKSNNIILEYFFGKSNEPSLPFNFDNLLDQPFYPKKGDVNNLISSYFKKETVSTDDSLETNEFQIANDLENQIIISYSPKDENGAMDTRYLANLEKISAIIVRPKQNTRELGFLKEYKKILNRPFDPNFKSYWAHSTAGILTNTQMENIVHHKNPLLEKKVVKKQVILEPIKKPETPTKEKCTKKHHKRHKPTCRHFHQDEVVTPALVQERLLKKQEKTKKEKTKEAEIVGPSMEFKLQVEEAPKSETASSANSNIDSYEGKNVSIDDNQFTDPIEYQKDSSKPADSLNPFVQSTQNEQTNYPASFDPFKPSSPFDSMKPLANPAVEYLKVDSCSQSPILKKKIPLQPVHRLQLERRLSLVKDSLGSFSKPVPISVFNTPRESFASPQRNSTKANVIPTSLSNQLSHAWISTEFNSNVSLDGAKSITSESVVNLQNSEDTGIDGPLTIKPPSRKNSLEYLPELILPPFIKLSTFRWKTAIYTVLQQQRLTEIPNMSHTEVKLNLSKFETPTFRAEQQVMLAALTGVHNLAMCKSAKEKDIKVDMKYLPFDETLCFFPHLKKQKLPVRLAIAGASWLKVVPRGNIIIREGDPVRIVYFLLAGLCVEHVKVEQPPDSPEPEKEDLIRLMKPSDTIGDIAGNVVTTRAFSLTTLTRCLFICVDRHDWLSSMRKGNFDIPKIEILSTLKIFMGLPPQTLEHLSSYTSETSVGLDEPIIEPHEEPEHYYFISKGKVKLSIYLPFVKTVTDDSKDLVSPEKFQVNFKLIPGGALLWANFKSRQG
ncbi:hypothetical protein HK103_001870 [Boothiomyces macroporosus]|uniref:Cyclic nucleotide-binding domain-containing protein n=1 Tax=Boothiomyces macroporosus TaxID=261099 RepID=A0AAD5UA18_9FUNG|nr:hypothetical protein HK103_001870 [Boothiomyces macroporosus]